MQNIRGKYALLKQAAESGEWRKYLIAER